MPHAMVVGSSLPAGVAIERRLLDAGFGLIERARDAEEAFGRPRHKVDLIAIASDRLPTGEELLGLARRFGAPVLVVDPDDANGSAWLPAPPRSTKRLDAGSISRRDPLGYGASHSSSRRSIPNVLPV